MSVLGLRFAQSRRVATVVSCWKCKKFAARNMHQLRDLPYNIEDGLGDFLSPPALKVVALDFQRGLLQRLNDEVRGTEEENKSVAQTVINTAADRSKTMAFNYASLALNNSFFLDMLKPPPPPPATSHEASINPYLGAIIRSEHGSLEQLKSNFSAAALGMVSSGWVWFVTDNNGRTAVLPTFGAGTLLVRSRLNIAPVSVRGPVLGEDVNAWRTGNFSSRGRQGSPVGSTRNPLPSVPAGPSSASPASGLPHSPLPAKPAAHSRSLRAPPMSSFDRLHSPASSFYGNNIPGASTEASSDLNNDDIAGMGEMLCPLFCLSVHEHTWMSGGYGVWGKEEWLKKFWTVLDWSKVSNTYSQFVPDRQTI